MTKITNTQRGWDDQDMNKAAEEFVSWYINELRFPTAETTLVPFMIEIKYDKNTYTAVTIIGEKEIEEHVKKKQ